ncbi:MAG TPA: zinc ribbon domain-containing protein [Tepidisphaeraceae bacterium]|nr:zinc ribbon domain-containing protein [Tepidisphaeraceae bacterium]
MPIYEYTCDSCHQTFDQLTRSMTTDTKVRCPTCNSPKTTRKMSLFAVSTESPKPSTPQSGGCGRCGGPNPCSMD